MQVVKDICDRVAVMQDGRVIEQGPILQIFTQPQEALTVDFVQTANHFAKQIETIDEHPSMVNVQSPRPGLFICLMLAVKPISL